MSDDYEKIEAKAVSAGKNAMSREFLSRRTGKGGLFAEIRQNDAVYPNHYMLLANDGVGTKLFLSQLMDRYDTVGFDLVAMNINDLATFGQVIPDVMNVYFAVQQKVEEEKMGDIVRGIDSALKQCVIKSSKWNINYGKHETASVEEMVTGPVPGYGYDIAATVTAFIEKKHLPSFAPEPGDIIVGIGSSGLHSNGYTFARHVLLDKVVEQRDEYKELYTGKFRLDDLIEGTKTTVGDALLAPTKLYLKTMSRICGITCSTYGVNITGYGLKNFNRFGKGIVYLIDDPMDPLPIHRLVMNEGKYDVEHAWTKMNMGMGFAVIVEDMEEARVACTIANEEGHDAKIVGKVVEGKADGPSVLLNLRGKDYAPDGDYSFEGYG